MAAIKQPWLKFYPSDWRADPAVRSCSMAARGLWIEMLCLMHEADPRGYLTLNARPMTDRQIATLAGCTPKEAACLLAELEEAGVFSRDDNGTVFSRRIIRDAEKAQQDKDNGKRGGNPSLKRGVNPPDKAQKPEARDHTERDKSLSERDLGEVQKIKSEIAGIYAPGDPPDMGRIDVWLAQGYPPDIIRGVVLEICRRHKPAALKYCDNPLEDAAAKRAPPMPPSIAAEDVPVFIDQDDEAIFARARELYPQATPKQTKRGRGIFVPPAIARQARQGAAA